MLPNTYLECDYIESFGNEYIETIQNKWINNAHFNFTFIPKNVSTYQVLFGNQNGYNATLLRIQTTGKLNLFFHNATINNNWDVDTLVINTKYNVDISLSTTNLIIKLNDVEKVNVSGNFTLNTSLTNNTDYLLCEHTQMGSSYAEQRYFTTCQLVNAFCEIDDVEKFNYLSCIRKSDSVVGLYDLVNDTFYTNQGSGEFGFRIKDKDINGFVNLDYIENHRLEYINTGITNVNNLRVDCDFTPTWLYGDTCVIGMRGDLGRRYFLNQYGNTFAVSNSGVFKTTSFNFVNHTRYKTSVIMKPNGVVAKVNDNVVFQESGTNEGETTYPLYIFACNYGNSAVYILNINRIHSACFMVGDTGEMLRIYQPKLRLSDMQSGLYDIINDVFYTNQGQGEFSYKVKELKINNDIWVKVGNEVKKVKKVI